MKTLNVISLTRFLHKPQDTRVWCGHLNSKFTFCIPLQQGVLFGRDWREDSTRLVVVPSLEIIAAHTNHITCVRFECMKCSAYPSVRLLGES